MQNSTKKYSHFLTFRIQNKANFEPYQPDDCEALAIKQVCIDSDSNELTINQYQDAATAAIKWSGYNPAYVEALVIGAICVRNTN